MKTFNILYKSSEALQHYISSNDLYKSREVLVQIFTGVLDRDFINLLISDILVLIPHAKILGSTTDGEIIDKDVTENATVLSFSTFERTTIKTYYSPYDGSSEHLAGSLYKQFDNPQEIKLMITFVDGLNTNGEKFIKTFEEYDENLLIAGGLAGDNAIFSETLVFNENGCYDNGAVAAIFFGDELIVNTTNSFGWKRIGKKLKVTKSKENIVYSIDGISAVDIYKKYLGQEISDDLPATGIEFPLIIHRNNIEIARAVIGIQKDIGALVFAGNISEGDVVQFGYGDIDTIKSLINTTKRTLLSKPVESVFIYSCMARKRLMGKTVLAEIVPLSKIAPTSGFFTYGELFTKENKHELLNQTMTILTLSENEKSMTEEVLEDKVIVRESNKTINALTHLVGVATDELSTLNETLQNKVIEEVEKNRKKDKQLLQQSRLAQMGEMISMIAHQWRQPLAAIGSSAGGLKIKAKLKKADNDLVMDICDNILFSSQHLSSTIDDFRDFYKSNKEVREVTFSEILDGVLNIVKESIKNKNISINIDIQYDGKITTYPNEIKQVVMNLVKNAEDVLLDKKIENPFIDIKTYKDKEKYILEVGDNGGGIKDSKIEFIFDPYFSTKKSKDGTGLGLYMSKTIIEEHCKGKLSVYNSDVGAVFKVELD